MRFDLYRLIHKAQRYHLFNLSIKIGNANFHNAEELKEIKDDIIHIIRHLKEHALNEDRFIHPLFFRIGKNISRLDEQHEEIENDLFELEAILKNDSRVNELYLIFNHFIAKYLLHIQMEETLQKTLLWDAYSDEDLMAVMKAFKSSRTQEQDEEDLDFILPTLSLAEKKLFSPAN